MYKTLFLPLSNVHFEYTEGIQHNMPVFHYHDSYELFFQTMESRKMFYNGYAYQLNPGDVFFLRPYEIHRGESVNENKYGRYVVNFLDNHIRLLLSESEYNLLLSRIGSGLYHLTEKQYEWMLHTFQSLHISTEKTGFLSDKIVSSYIVQILYILKDAQFHTTENEPDIAHSEMRPELITAIDYIHKNYQNDINLDQVAQRIHMSKYYFCRLFSNALDISFLDYLNKVRLAKVHQLLVETDLSISEIAKNTGFHSTAHLSRIFSSEYKMTPREFRKSNI